MKLDQALLLIRNLKESIERLEKLDGHELRMDVMLAYSFEWRETVVISAEQIQEIVAATLESHRADLARLQSVIDLAETALRGLDA